MSAILIISGTVGNTPELKEIGEKVLTRLSIAEDIYLGKDRDKKTIWHQVTVWDGQAKRAVKYLGKGSVISATCRVSYTDRDGQRYTNFNAIEVDYLANFGKSRNGG